MFILRLTTSLPKLCQSCQSATLAEKKQALLQMPAFLYLNKTIKNILLHIVNHLHQFLANLIGSFHRSCFAIYANDWLRIRLTQMNPTVGEVNLDTIYVVDLCRTSVSGVRSMRFLAI